MLQPVAEAFHLVGAAFAMGDRLVRFSAQAVDTREQIHGR
jgi:hypothetical protein